MQEFHEAYCKKDNEFFNYANYDENKKHLSHFEHSITIIPKKLSTEYSFQKCLGSGGYGIVFQVLSKKDKRSYALKLINAEDKNELKFSNLNNPYIIKFIDIKKYPQENKFALIMELADTTLYKYIKEYKNITIDAILKLFLEICLGLKYLHEKYIMHKDLKPTNILIINNCAKIADFGISRQLESFHTLPGTEIPKGTPSFLPPEYYQQEPYNPELFDVFSLGKTFDHVLNYSKLPENQEIFLEEIIESNS